MRRRDLPVRPGCAGSSRRCSAPRGRSGARGAAARPSAPSRRSTRRRRGARPAASARILQPGTARPRPEPSPAPRSGRRSAAQGAERGRGGGRGNWPPGTASSESRRPAPNFSDLPTLATFTLSSPLFFLKTKPLASLDGLTSSLFPRLPPPD